MLWPKQVANGSQQFVSLGPPLLSTQGTITGFHMMAQIPPMSAVAN
jgi:hypothetical protein